MINRDELLQYLSQLLVPTHFNDYCPNGLQVEGKSTISKIITGVSANAALIEAACHEGADALLVHHGFFWRGETPCIVGQKYNRIQQLIKHDINLLAYHLPLDAHTTVGNNAQLANVLGIIPVGQINAGDPAGLVWHGVLPDVCSGEDFARHIALKLNRTPLHIPGSQDQIKTIAWCTGAAQDYIQIAIDHGVDAFLTGEVSERTVDAAREAGMHFYAAGHYATERYGIQAVGNLLAEHFSLTHQFIEMNNPV